jgi:class 3 adenylate cyclase
MGNETPSSRTARAGVERKLTAILSADVKGYSRLMGDDEVATVRTLTAYREVMTTLIQQHHGRVVDSPGDNLLAEFASAVDAVQCAVAIQGALKVRNAELPALRQMEYRMGINVGDVIVEGERLYGDGVNIAARLEGLAEPGGICISGTVLDHVKNKLALRYKDLGEQTVKNIADPVRVWRVVMDEAAAALAEQGVLRQAQHERESTPGHPEPVEGRPAISVGRRPPCLGGDRAGAHRWSSRSRPVSFSSATQPSVLSTRYSGSACASAARQTLTHHPALCQHE